ncbi:hypothetical protein Bhyg_15795 [Pseudolycoriella hygida]|uniref:Uncharacterized protein n=1 Tax=Pseudolycoriella hygida TaxID=35572 RepID=A0A9Q0MJN3_9DIPT|nr:hypothetical protein Bhyg_15795 [Pseudolycoriella hygida]
MKICNLSEDKITSLMCILPFTYGLTVTNARADKVPSKLANNQDKRSLLIGDVSYSYSATDIGSDKGSHVKTITVIKNIGSPTFHKNPQHSHGEWDNSKKGFNFVFKFPEIPQIDTGTFFQTEKPKKVIPTKQPTDRHIPTFNTDFEANEVEYIQTEGEESKSVMIPPTAMTDSKKVDPPQASSTNGYRISTAYQNRLKNQRPSSDLIEDFSDYSMHNVKHLVDPIKVKDSLLKYSQNQSSLDLKKLANVELIKKDEKLDSYGNVVEKSQSLLDASQTSQRAYISPSLKKDKAPSQPSLTKIASTTKSNGLKFFSTTQRAYVAPKKLKTLDDSKAEKLVIKPSVESESIQKPLYSLQLNDGQSEQKYEFKPSPAKYQQPKNFNSPPKQLNEEKPIHSYSIRNPLTTSLPVQHNHKPKLHPKVQKYVAVPMDGDIPKHLSTMPKRYVRHHKVFDSKPPHSFMEPPF